MSDRLRHLSATTWEQLACGELPGAEEDLAREHIAVCDDCRATWAALADLRAAAETFDPGLREPLPEPLRPRFGRPALQVTLAIAAALVAVLGVSQWQRQPAVSPTAPYVPIGSDRAGRAARPEPRLPSEGAVGDVAGFSWSGSPAIGRYAVELLDGDGAVLWRSAETDQLQIPWPEAVDKAPGTYYWRVLAVDGGHDVSSELVRFELAR
jgi:hypothetical protein